MRILFTIFIILLAVDSAFSCSCVNTNSKLTPSESLKFFDVIFEGKVISVGEIVEHKKKNRKGKYYISSLTYEVEFEVTRTWRGVETKKIKIDSEPTTCHLDYSVGKSYFVLAFKHPETDRLTDANYCARSDVTIEVVRNELGEGISFEKPQQTEPTESFWSYLWNKILSFFS